jgi:hypothetical protein
VDYVIVCCVDVEKGKVQCERFVLEDLALQIEGVDLVTTRSCPVTKL